MGPNSECTLSPQDWEFVKKLTRAASVRVLSSQVTLLIDKSDMNFQYDKNNLLSFPSNLALEYISIVPSKYEDDHMVRMTWKVLPK